MRMVLAAIIAGVLAAPLPLAAQQAAGSGAADQPKVDVTRNGDWEVACQEVDRNGQKTKACEMRQVLVQKETKKEWLRLAVSYAPDGKGPVLRIFTPLGVLLQPGMVMTIDNGEPVRMQYAVCLARPPRCLVAGPMDEKLTNLMKRGIQGQLSIMLPNNQQVNAPFSLKGFTASLNSLPQ